MRRLPPLAGAAAALLAWHAGAALAQAPEPAAATRPDLRPVVAGLGAIAGVVAFNAAALGPAALPGGMAYAAGASVPAEMSVAMSRVYATTSAVIGGWAGYYGDPRPSGDRLLAAGVGAVAGAAAFNVLTAPLGTVPLAGGTLAAVPYSIALGSRLIAVTSAGAGALGASWLYDRWTGGRWTGGQSDDRYLLALGAGALAGVAAGNYLTSGALGVLPAYAGAGAANAAGALASPAAQAASRVYVIGTAVLGAWAADWYYRR